MPSDKDRLLQEYVRTHDEALLDEICRAYLPLAGAVARRFSGRGVEYDDLFQVASLALVKAVKRFDPDRGVQFSTYVTPTIVGEVKNYFRDKSRLVSIPRRSGALIHDMEAARERLTHALTRSPTPQELAGEMGESVETVLELLEIQGASRPVSLDAPPSDGDEDLSLHAVLGVEENGYQAVETRDLFERVMAALSEEEKRILQRRFFEGQSQREVADALHVSQMTISRMERKLLDKARKILED